MADFSERGFVACRKLGGGEAIQKTFAVSASTNQAYFIGDAVALNTTGKVAPLTGARPLLGVITALMKSTNGKPRPLSFNQPGAGPYLTSGQAGFALVNVDPNQTYVAVIGATGNEALIGGVAKVSAGAPNTANGLSGQSLGSTISTSGAASIDPDAHFQIVGLAPVELLQTRTSVASQALVECKPVRPVFGGNPI